MLCMQSEDFTTEVTLKLGFENGGFELMIQGVKDFYGRKNMPQVTEARENTVWLDRCEKGPACIKTFCSIFLFLVFFPSFSFTYVTCLIFFPLHLLCCYSFLSPFSSPLFKIFLTYLSISPFRRGTPISMWCHRFKTNYSCSYGK